jgi:polysaccharide deacetylase family protein (PEP-CTERM system associated)
VGILDTQDEFLWDRRLVDGPPRDGGLGEGVGFRVVLSFDVEEHHRIEAAAGLLVDPHLKRHYGERASSVTSWLLDCLAEREIRATFFVVGQVAREDPDLVRAIQRAGHEVASHGWDHRRILSMTPTEFREDLRLSCDALEQVTGEAVVGYRAPTFSVVRRTAWALDVMAERGLLYDSSIYPVRHDRYGVPGACRGPFVAQGMKRSIMELPPATLRLAQSRIPVGGGGYFRLLPLAVLERALAQTHRECRPPVAVLYFHPWEFDPEQPRLPLRRLSRFRTYVGIDRSRVRLLTLLSRRYVFSRAVDVARQLDPGRLPRVSVAVD